MDGLHSHPPPKAHSLDDPDVLGSVQLLLVCGVDVSDADQVLALPVAQGDVVAVHQHPHLKENLRTETEHRKKLPGDELP